MDLVFRALADPTRRDLLDRLYRHDGQTLQELTSPYPMRVIGVMKHLQLLEDAGLVVTKRRGREKLHFLNAVPIRQVHDRWVSKFAEPWTAELSDIKAQLEATMEKVFEIYIRTTPERLWQVITDRATRAKFQFGCVVESDWMVGSRYELSHPKADHLIVEGQNLVVEPPSRLVQSFHALWDDDAAGQGTSRVTWEIEPVGDSCRLTVTHDQLPEGVDAAIYGGWPMILSGLKSWIETGEALTTPGSLAFG
jgi:uncharacterized protein YndB with AHSA1/START domain